MKFTPHFLKIAWASRYNSKAAFLSDREPPPDFPLAACPRVATARWHLLRYLMESEGQMAEDQVHRHAPVRSLELGAKTNGLSLTLGFQQPITISAKKVQRGT
jgi:hypothetical protein